MAELLDPAATNFIAVAAPQGQPQKAAAGLDRLRPQPAAPPFDSIIRKQDIHDG